jgi:uncharacterized membrane protein YccF (DUF307 family)
MLGIFLKCLLCAAGIICNLVIYLPSSREYQISLTSYWPYGAMTFINRPSVLPQKEKKKNK